MERIEKIYNNWQVYQAGYEVYTSKERREFKKLDLFEDKIDIMNFEVIHKHNDVMIIASNENRLFFIFVGSDDPGDWINNFDAKMLKVSCGIGIHEGFYKSSFKFYEKIHNEIEYLKSKFPSDCEVSFIGHSRGGAMALISAYLILDMSNEIQINIYTYGQPRVGNHEFDKQLQRINVNYTRVILNHDIVCDVPPIILGYEHPWFGDIIRLPESWWMKFPIFFKKVHLSYDTIINTKIKKNIIKQLYHHSY